MPRKFLTDLEQIAAFGTEVTVSPEAALISEKSSFTLNLSDNGKQTVTEFATLAMYLKQKDVGQKSYRKDGIPVPNPVAPIGFQELYLELIEMADALGVVGGDIIYLPPNATPPAMPIVVTSVEAAQAAGHTVPTEYTYQVFVKEDPLVFGPDGNPIPDHYEDRTRPVKPLDLYLIATILTEQGPKGDKGDPGDSIVGPVGPAGPAGSDAVCGDCGSPPGGTNPTGPSGPNGDGGGSGAGGAPNPDGRDTVVYISGCPDPIINFPYCSESFSFANADLRAAINSAVAATGKFNSSTEELVSCVLEWTGAAYGGVAEVTVDTEAGYTGSGGNVAGVLTVTDASPSTFQVPYQVESFGVPGVLVVIGYHYNGNTGIRLLPASNPVTLTGEMSTYPLMGTGNCSNPPNANDPAWLKVCLRSFVKHLILGCGPGTDYLCMPGDYPAGDDFFRSHTGPQNSSWHYYSYAAYGAAATPDGQILSDAVSGFSGLSISNCLWNDVQAGARHIEMVFHLQTAGNHVNVQVVLGSQTLNYDYDNSTNAQPLVIDAVWDVTLTQTDIDTPFEIKLVSSGGGSSQRFNRITCTVS